MEEEYFEKLLQAIQPFIGEEEHSVTEALYDEFDPNEREDVESLIVEHREQTDRLRFAFGQYKAARAKR